MIFMLPLVNQISLGMASLSLAVGTLTATPPADLNLEPANLGGDHVALVDKATGELSQSLPFDLNTLSPPVKAKKPVVASAKASITPPPSPYEAWFNQYANQFGLDVNFLKKIAWCESHYNYGSISSSGAYGGMFQFSASTWASTRNAMGADPNPELRFDPEQAILTAAFKIAAGGSGAWPVCSLR